MRSPEDPREVAAEGLRAGRSSDADPGAALAPPRPAPRRPGLIPTEIADALSAVLGKAGTAIRANEAGSRAGGDLESVHQMRVATRRIRAYLKAARPALDAQAADGLRLDLADLARALGEVRDLDVMIDRMHSEATALGEPDTAALERLIGSLDADRGVARKALVAQLDEPSYRSLLEELDRAVERPPVADPWADLAELGAAEFGRLAKAHRRLVKKFDGDPPDDDLHELRILGKRARYTAELQPKSRRMSEFLEALAHFQEVLGDHQDASVLEDQLRLMVAASHDPAAAVAAGRVIEGGRRRKMAARELYPAAWKAVDRAADAAYPRD
ncbi:CHAD domain-containing protein [Nakamurella sp. UYEF19]|uniref:CHAD domain-containing protein n=1 Tax=Nakamurella sp. UYEF19 TaxID=1756392 RepID=UPI0033935692